jgi:hypothetical protein
MKNTSAYMRERTAQGRGRARVQDKTAQNPPVFLFYPSFLFIL